MKLGMKRMDVTGDDQINMDEKVSNIQLLKFPFLCLLCFPSLFSSFISNFPLSECLKWCTEFCAFSAPQSPSKESLPDTHSYLCFFWSSRYLSPEHELWLFIRISSSISYFIGKAVSIKKHKQLRIPKLQGKAVSMQQHTTAPMEGKRYVPEETLCSTQTFIAFSTAPAAPGAGHHLDMSVKTWLIQHPS